MAFVSKRKTRKGRMRRGKMPIKTLVRKEVNKVFNKRVETKTFDYSNSAMPNPYTAITYNIFYHNVTTGASPTQLIGQSLNWRGLKLKYRVTNSYISGSSLVYSTQPVYLDVYVIETDTYKSTTSLSLSEVFTNPSLPENGFLLKGVKILASKKVSIVPNLSDTTGQQHIKEGSIWLRRNQKIEFIRPANVSHELTRKNYYVMFVPRCTWTGTNCLTFDFSYKNYFQDS